MDLTEGTSRRCEVALPYPAPECGFWLVRCGECDFSAAITAAGRPDDPKRVIVPCGRTFCISHYEVHDQPCEEMIKAHEGEKERIRKALDLAAREVSE